MAATRRKCGKCQDEFWDDGHTWCPSCDSADIAGKARSPYYLSAGILPNAGVRVYEMRMGKQRKIESEAKL
jgi:hypothetical protein